MSNYHCNTDHKVYLIRTYGFTKDPKLDDYILVIQYASKGDLHKYLQKNFTTINWRQKINILREISYGYLYLNI
jgi:hypothetical protein